jgi:hypothetical protein
MNGTELNRPSEFLLYVDVNLLVGKSRYCDEYAHF